MADSHTPIFLIGTQRSGTTLLTRMLSSHSKLYIQNEMAMNGVFQHPYDSELLHKRITHRLMGVYGVNVPALTEDGIQWGWKDPLLTDHLEELISCYPHSKFIILVRDPRAVVASYIENAWGLGTNVYSGSQRWKSEVERQVHFAEQHSERCFLIKFEELLQDSEVYLEKICRFLALPFDKAMLSYFEKPLEFTENKSNMNTQKPLDKANMSKWKTQFSARQVGIINTICKDLIESLGYDDSVDYQTRCWWLERCYYQCHQSIIGEIQLQFQLRKMRRNRKE